METKKHFKQNRRAEKKFKKKNWRPEKNFKKKNWRAQKFQEIFFTSLKNIHPKKSKGIKQIC